MTSNEGEFLDILNTFDDVNDLMFYAESLGLQNDPQIEERYRQILAYQDFGEMLQNFDSVEALSDFAERNGLGNDSQVVERLHQLMNEDANYNDLGQIVQNFNDVSELNRYAYENDLMSHPEILNRMNDLIEGSFCRKCFRKFPNNSAKAVHETNCQGSVSIPSTSYSDSPLPSLTTPAKPTFDCKVCGLSLTRKRNRDVHETRCRQKKTCVQCEQTFSSPSTFASHKCEVKCKHCPATFANASIKNSHEKVVRNQLSVKMQKDIQIKKGIRQTRLQTQESKL